MRITAPRGGRGKGPAAPSSSHPVSACLLSPPRQVQQHIMRLEAPLEQGQRAGSRRR